MVSLYPNPPAQDCYKVVNPIKMGYFPGGFNSLSSSTDAAATISTNADNSSMIYESEDPNNKKVRKPYTITKCRETWTDQEHDKFIEALHLFDRDWKKIEAFIGSKTVIQIRSHAQKYFLKVQKNGTSEHVPPPRPKRKAAHPYPQNAPKNVIPDFAQVYSFIASVLDSNASDHLRRLKMMDPINVETVLILMKNLAVNLTSPEFENHDQQEIFATSSCQLQPTVKYSSCV